MARFIFLSLSSNTSAIIAATILFYIGHIITDGGALSLTFAAFLLSPILISIANHNRCPIASYFSKLITIRSLKYFFVLLLIFVLAIVLTYIIASQIDESSSLTIFIALIYGVCYLAASPILFGIATGGTGSFPSVKKAIPIVGIVLAYALMTKVLTAMSYSNGLFLIVTSLIGCFLLVIAFCVITAIYSYGVE